MGLSENVVYLNGSQFNGENDDQPMDLEVPYFAQWRATVYSVL